MERKTDKKRPFYFYFGPMVKHFIESCYDIELLSDNMDLAVISMHSTYCQTLFFMLSLLIYKFGEKVL